MGRGHVVGSLFLASLLVAWALAMPNLVAAGLYTDPTTAAMAALLGSAALVLASGVLAARGLLPIRRMREAVRAVGHSGDAAQRIAIAGRGEVPALAQAINEMLASLETARRNADAANRAKGEFLANMSHEIRTPMTAILGFAEELLAEPGWEFAPPQRHNAVRTIRRNGEYLLELINDILDLSKIEAEKFELDLSSASPLLLMAEVTALMKVRADGKGLALVAQFQGPAPETIVTDRTRVRQILINLLGNAIKFTEQGGVRLVAQMIDLDAPRARIRLNIVDTGVGITAEQMERLFRPFTQADASTTRKYGGTGLGLTISKRLAQLLGGDITLTSEPGKGTTFSVTLDAGLSQDLRWIHDPARKLDELMQVKKPMSETAPQIAIAGRVLLAEDSPDNQRLLGHLLRRAGAELTVVENGQLAYESARLAEAAARPYHVILMDMQMPVLDGYSAARQLREAGYRGTIIALTAHAMSSDRERCIEAGCDDYATKPIDRRLLLETVAKYCAGATRPELVETSPMF